MYNLSKVLLKHVVLYIIMCQEQLVTEILKVIKRSKDEASQCEKYVFRHGKKNFNWSM